MGCGLTCVSSSVHDDADDGDQGQLCLLSVGETHKG